MPPSPPNSLFFLWRWQKWATSTSHSLLRSQTGGILQFSVVVNEILCQKASSLRLNVRPPDRRGRWCRLTLLAMVNAGTIKHKVLQGTTIWERMSGPRRVIKLIIAQVSPKIMNAIDFEGSPCTFLRHSFPASSANWSNSTCRNVYRNGCWKHTGDASVTCHASIRQLAIVLISQCPVRKQDFTIQ